jgi:hypothetical protein
MDETKVKITNPERVARILNKICQSNLQVFMRTELNQGLAVKGKASNIVSAKLPDSTKVLTLRVSNISEPGMDYLSHQEKVQVEFIMMATKVVFVSKIISTEQNSILVSFPKSLVSIERRKNARFLTNEATIGFVRMSIWQPNYRDTTTPPVFPQYRLLAGNMPILDLSSGGICLGTRFPSVFQELKRGKIDEEAILLLPMQRPIETTLEVRWVKKIKEHAKDPLGEIRSFTSYRFGCEFRAESEEVKVGIRQFVAQLTESEAI